MNEKSLLIFSSAITGITWGANSLIVSLYFHELGLPVLLIGIILTVGTLSGAFLGYLFSIFGDAFGRKKIQIISRILYAFGILLLIERIPLGYLLFSRSNMNSVLLVEKGGNLEKTFGLMNSLSIVASFVGALIPSFLKFSNVFAIEEIAILVSIISLIPVRESYKGTRKITPKIGSIGTVSKFSVEALTGLGAGMLLPLLSLWFSLKFHAPIDEISPFFAVSNLTLAVGTYISPYIGKYLGNLKTIVTFHFIAIALLFYMPFSATALVAGTVYVFRNVFMNMTQPLWTSMFMKVIPENERGRGMSLVSLFDSIPRSMGPTIGGFFFSIDNLYLPFLITGLLYLISNIVFYLLFRRIVE
ncbi:MFS transporter [Sulfolobales archaeon HS-7]|nr:MFS transporter [Sulfolobales archaeon HS-7]